MWRIRSRRLFDNAIAALQGSQAGLASGVQSDDGSSSAAQAGLFADDHNPIRIGLSNNINRATAKLPNSPSNSDVDQFSDLVSNQGQQTQATLAQVELAPSGWGDTTDMMSTTLVTLLTAGKAVSNFALTSVGSVIGSAMDGIAASITAVNDDIITAPWDVPLVSEFYSQLTNGATLSALDLTALLLAVPTTMLIKLTYPNAMPTASVIAQFNAWCTPANLMAGAGLQPHIPSAPCGTSRRFPEMILHGRTIWHSFLATCRLLSPSPLFLWRRSWTSISISSN